MTSTSSRTHPESKAPDGDAALEPHAHMAIVAQIDGKNRVSIPKAMRDAVGVGPGDAVFFDLEEAGPGVPVLRLVKAVNPLAVMIDALAEDAIRQYERGETLTLDELWAELDQEDEAQEAGPGQ